MRTLFRADKQYADILKQCAADYQIETPAYPDRFIKKMKENQGSVAGITGLGLDEEGLERKNPVIVALGDSVTAGHFESLLPTDPAVIAEYVDAMTGQAPEKLAALPPLEVEVTDSRESYVEKFRMKLIDRFEKTSVSLINAGIAGDNLVMMAKRACRDVIRYDPDLVLINGSLNWGPDLGTTEDYRQLLAGLVRRLKAETTADIILLTPNGDVTGMPPFIVAMGAPVMETTTPERVAVIREIAREENVCLADVRAVWDMALDRGCPWEALLANGINHPDVTGHEVYADVLMKLFP